MATREPEPSEKTKRHARRMLAAIYRLSGGKADVPISRDAFMAEAKRVNLFGMSDEEFERYHVESVMMTKGGRN